MLFELTLKDLIEVCEDEDVDDPFDGVTSSWEPNCSVNLLISLESLLILSNGLIFDDEGKDNSSTIEECLESEFKLLFGETLLSNDTLLLFCSEYELLLSCNELYNLWYVLL